jgi:hypothetical protein
MWNAKLENIKYDLSVNNERFDMIVRFIHTDTRSYLKTYTLQLDDLSDVSLLGFKSIIQVDLDRLNKLENILGNLSSKIGKTM